MNEPHHPHHPHYDEMNPHAARKWQGMPLGLIARPYGNMTLDEARRQPHMVPVQKNPRLEEDEQNRSKMAALLFMAASILLPRTMLWSMTPVMVIGLVAKMLGGTPEEKRRLAEQYGLPEPKAKKHEKREDKDADYYVDPTAPVFVLNPEVEKVSGWRYLALLPKEVIAFVAGVGRRSLRAGLKTVQAVEQNILAMTMPHPRMAPMALTPTPSVSI